MQPLASSNCMGYVTLFLSVLIVLGGIVKNMDNKRRISAIDTQIANLEKEIANQKPLIKNKQVYLESLKSSKVADFARQMKMVSPRPGQICVVTEKDYAVKELMLVSNGERAEGQEVAVLSGMVRR